MERKIIVFDIDGTLTTSKKEISKKTKAAIIQAQEEGHLIALASGRPTNGLVDFAKELNFDKYGGYLLSFNGGRIQNYQTKQIICQSILPKDVIKTIYNYCQLNDIVMITYLDDLIIASKKDEFIAIESRINKMEVKVVENFPEFVKNYDLNKCLLTCKPEHSKEYELALAKMFDGKLSVYRSEPFFIEIMPLGIDKATSLDRLIKRYEISEKDLLAFGDGFNDISMIEYAGVGVAMGNAQQAVKDVAQFVTLNNDEDGIAHALKEILK